MNIAQIARSSLQLQSFTLNLRERKKISAFSLSYAQWALAIAQV
jgi:hypothetical protein